MEGTDIVLSPAPRGKLAGDDGYAFILDAGRIEMENELIPHVLRAIHELGGSAKSEKGYALIRENAGITQQSWSYRWYVNRRNNNRSPKVRHCIGWALYHLRKARYVLDYRASGFGIWTLTEKAKKERARWLNPANWESFSESVMSAAAKAMGKVAKSKNSNNADSVSHDGADDGISIDDEAAIKKSVEADGALLQSLHSLHWSMVEDLVGIVAEHAGYVNCGRTSDGRDEGIDLWGYRPVGGFHHVPVAFQVKRWEKGAVGGPEIDKFIGACTRNNGCEGVFVCTSGFRGEAEKRARLGGIVLIDGDKLLDLMDQHRVWDTLAREIEYSTLVAEKIRIDGAK